MTIAIKPITGTLYQYKGYNNIRHTVFDKPANPSPPTKEQFLEWYRDDKNHRNQIDSIVMETRKTILMVLEVDDRTGHHNQAVSQVKVIASVTGQVGWIEWFHQSWERIGGT